MRFETIEYLEWAKTHSRAEIELTRSSVDDLPLEELRVEFKELKLNIARAYGFPPLLDALAAIYQVGRERIATSIGTSQALFLVCSALLEPGDDVLVEEPAYEPLRAVPAALGARVVRFQREFANGFQVRTDEIERALTPHTRLVILSNLHNPSGVEMDPSTMTGLAEAAATVGADVVVDEVYLDFVEQAGRKSAARLAENMIVISSLAKVYGMAGLRCGWAVARPEVVERVERVMDYVNGEGVHIGEQIALRGLERLAEVRVRHRSRLRSNLTLVDDFIEQTPALSWVRPAGGVVGFPRIEAGFDGDTLAERLYNRHATGIVPGRFFERRDFFRIGFGLERDVVARGLERIGRAIRELEA